MTAPGHLQHEPDVFTMPPRQAALFDGGMLPFDPIVLFTMNARCRETPRLTARVPDFGDLAGQRWLD